MIKVFSFDYGDELERFINSNNISREQIIDIKWTGTGHATWGLLIYEE